MPGIRDWIGEPLYFVSSYLDQFSADQYREKTLNFFTKNITSTEESKQWIPSFNSTPLDNIKCNSLVRFRCMVQDMFGPELYYDVFDTENTATGERKLLTGRYQDVTSENENLNILHNSPVTKMSERHVFYCVPIPGETEWVKQGHQAMCMAPDVSCSSAPSQGFKRSLEDDVGEEMELQATDDSSKRSRSAPATEGSSVVTSQVQMNFPLPGETGPAALVKMYDDVGDKMKINDVIEVYGVISLDPSLVPVHTEDSEMLSAEEHKAHNPPPSLVPRIHAIYVNKIQTSNPLLPASIDNSSQELAAIKTEACEIRENLLGLLEHALHGDKLCAEYMLLHLLSSVYMRRDTIAVGKFSLNITGVNANEQLLVNSLVELIQQFVATSYYLPMSLDNLNKLKFTPVKDYDSDRLVSGVLQLPNRCHLILDETVMQPGQLDVAGVKNLEALGNLVRWQKVKYDFKYSNPEFETDVPVICLSEGKSLLNFDSTVPLQIENSLNLKSRLEAIKTYLSPALLDKIRIYLTLIPRLNYEISEEMTQMAQEDFVKTRQANKDAMTPEDFQSLLVVSRLLSLSCGLSNLSADVWAKAKVLEECRKSRLPK
ncbi:MCMBP [Bugula neritina]|uniref:Mini-chromosome maintenance complex-binding protein n=1 Tax=Bugula neritina TaxID=10212 RepID=A0A7J7IZL2_BUGNE|nr:MCMBP [Bugula neritina]